MNPALFIITENSSSGSTVNIKSKHYNTYNRCGVRKADLFCVMCELSDIFNNVLGVGISFEVE